MYGSSSDFGALPGHAEDIARPTQELDPESAELDVDRGRKLLPDRAGRQGRRSLRIGRVAFDHLHLPGELGIEEEEARDRAADCPAADHHHLLFCLLFCHLFLRRALRFDTLPAHSIASPLSTETRVSATIRHIPAGEVHAALGYPELVEALRAAFIAD